MAASKPSGGRSVVDEVDTMMTLEDMARQVGRPVRGAGSNLADMGF